MLIVSVDWSLPYVAIADYLKDNNNYKIYHTIDDYLVSKEQLAQLKECAGNNLVLVNNGSHLGYLYRNEFIAELKHEIAKINKLLPLSKIEYNCKRTVELRRKNRKVYVKNVKMLTFVSNYIKN